MRVLKKKKTVSVQSLKFFFKGKFQNMKPLLGFFCFITWYEVAVGGETVVWADVAVNETHDCDLSIVMTMCWLNFERQWEEKRRGKSKEDYDDWFHGSQLWETTINHRLPHKPSPRWFGLKTAQHKKQALPYSLMKEDGFVVWIKRANSWWRSNCNQKWTSLSFSQKTKTCECSLAVLDFFHV